MDNETKIEILKDTIVVFESFLEYDWYCQKRVKEIKEEIARLKEVKKGQLSNE